jgi:GAF domain-containing protein
LLRETANSEILGLISKSPGDLKLVFRTILEDATRICNAKFGTLYRFDGENFHAAAQFNTPTALLEAQTRRGPFRPSPGSPFDRLMQTKQVIHSADITVEAVPGMAANFGGARSIIAVPMLKDDAWIGAILIYRQEVRPFTDKQIELVKNFAAQAVIAIESTRLLNELRQSLEQQTATADVLKVISASPGELEPVFQTMVENATRICEAKFGVMQLSESDGLRAVALHDVPPAYAEAMRRDPVFRPIVGHPLDRVASAKQVVHILDARAEQRMRGWMVELAGARTLLLVPMLKDNELLGVISIYRQEVRPFTEKQIALVQNFASQAVIAIENARLLNELRQRTTDLGEALEQQTATADVLHVISSSPGDLKPVFDAILENATRICEAKFGALLLSEGGAFRVVAMHNPPPAYAELRQREPIIQPGGNLALTRAIATKRAVQIADATDDPANQDDPVRRSFAAVTGARSFIVVPMLKDNEVIGVINVYRQEVRPFADKQIALLTNFAAQAVIAIENTRLLNELRESVERQTATADILRVIAGTPEDSKRALDTIAETASRMFGVANVNFRRIEDDVLRIVSSAGPTTERLRKALPDIPLEPTDPAVRCFLDNRQIPVEDRRAVLANERGAIATALRELPVRSQVFTPLSRQGKAIGVMIVTRGEVQPFQQGDLDLMKGFADQAVIAIENARLLSELRESYRLVQAAGRENGSAVAGTR